MPLNDGRHRKDPKGPVGKKVEFYVDCPSCFEESSEVEYFPTENFIRWTCPNGHPNFIENLGVSL